MFPSNGTSQDSGALRQEELTEKIIVSVKGSRPIRAVQQQADDMGDRITHIGERMSSLVEAALIKLHLDHPRRRR